MQWLPIFANLLLVHHTQSHPQSWLEQKQLLDTDDSYFLNSKCEALSNVTFYSYHIHVLFWQNSNDSIQAAFKLYNQFMIDFNINSSIPCNDINTTHNQSPQLCIVDFDYPKPACPFVTTEWAAFVPSYMFSETVQWVMLHHNVVLTSNDIDLEQLEGVGGAATETVVSLDVMIHPNSGCEIYDHIEWPLWIGNKWEIDAI